MARAGLLATAVTALIALAAPTAATRTSRSRDWAYALAIQPDGKLVAAGRSVGGGWGFGLARYTTRGKLDPSFGQGGEAFTVFGGIGSASTLAIQRDGRIVAAGQTYVGPEQDVVVVRYTSRGRLDTSFGRGGKVLTDFSPSTKTYDYARALVLQRDSKLVVAGDSVSFSLNSGRRALARYTPRGRLDRSFGKNGKVLSRAGASGGAADAAIQQDGKIVTAGSGPAGFVLARYTPQGRLDRSFGRGGTVSTKLRSFSDAAAVAIQRDGKIVVVGAADLDFEIARYTVAGKLDRSFGNGGKVLTNIGFVTQPGGGRYSSDDHALSAAIQADGKLVVAGSSDALSLVGEKGCCLQDFALVRYTADGSVDRSFGNGGKVLTAFGGDSYAEGVVIQPDGKIVAAGGGAGRFVLARYTDGGKLDPTFGRGGKVKTTLRP
jgi:uncharacterized delta-60 repeat protein